VGQAVGRRAFGAPAMRALGWFWGATLVVMALGAGVLQMLGAPSHPAVTEAVPPPSPSPPLSPSGAARPVAAPPTAGLEQVGSTPAAPGRIAAPDPALLEPSKVFAGGVLPRIGPTGRKPMQAYAAPFDAAEAAGRPRVALLLSGIGMSETDSEEAIHTTPGAVSLAVSPYSFRPERLLADARATGHEVLLSLPLEPDRYPIDDPGNRALLTGNAPEVNQQRLEWALTRFAGYVGVTGALNGMRGERFAGARELMAPVLQDLAARGLLYVDPRPGATPPGRIAGRDVDVLVDEPAPVRAEIEAHLARLEQVARDHGSALGLVGMPRPVTLDRIAAWAATLGSRGIVLVPVSAIVQPPPAKQTN
jgi:uncharacterized protein